MSWPFRGHARRNAELSEEMQAHLMLAERDAVEAGLSAAESRSAALREFGGVEIAKEVTRDVWGWLWLVDALQDLRYALRSFRQRPGFAMVALSTLSLGIGAATLMFSLFSGVLLKPLPYPRPDRLVAVNGQSTTWNTRAWGEQKLAYPDFLDCQRDAQSAELAALVYDSGTLSEPAPSEYLDHKFEISPELFSVVRVALTQGRAFLPEEDRIGAPPVAILGYSFWQRHFGGRADVVGSPITVDQKRYTIVGVAPKGFRLYGDEADVYTPLGQDNAGYLRNRAAQPVHVVGRLREGATVAQAQAELGLTAQRLAQTFADTNKDRGLVVKRLRRDVSEARFTLWLLLGAVSLLLVITCANVASLMLARAVSRERELAMRVALGASRGRLVRQCLTESGLMGICGGLLGILFAANGLRPFLSFWPGDLPRAEEVQVDWRVLLFAVVISLLSGLFFGLAPALRAPHRDVEAILRSGARSVVGSSRRLHGVFVVSQMVLAVVLLVAAGMLGRALLYASSLDPGLDVHNLLVARMALSPATLADTSRIPAAWREIIERARRVPGVDAVTAVDIVPMRQGNNQIGYWPSAAVPPQNLQPIALASSATPEFLQVTGIPLLEGRFFNEHDRMDTEPVVVIDEVLAKNAFGPQDPIGRNLWIPDMPCMQPAKSFATCKAPFKVVGLVRHVRYWGLAGDDSAEVRAQMYYPFSQVAPQFLVRWSQLMSVAVRTSVPPLSVLDALRQELRGVSGDQVLYEVHTMEELARESLAQQRFLLLLFAVFAGLALLLACIGIYGVLAYLTSQRVPEMGIRMAMGASPGSVLWLVLRQSLTMVVVGVGIGALAALAAGRVMARLVEGMQPLTISTFAVTIPLLVAAALLASFLPAKRASQVDPLVALRFE